MIMNMRIKKWMAGFFLAWAMAVLVPFQMMNVYAASGKIAFSDPSTTVGSEVSVNLKVSAAEGDTLGNADITVNYDASMLEFISGNSVEGGAGSLSAKGVPGADNKSVIVFSMKFKALQAGTTKLTIARQEVYDADAQLVTISHEGSSTVTIQALATASTDASLASLAISPGTLNPAFSPEVESYSVSVGADVEKITVDAQAADSNASVVVSGSDGLQMGENTVVCKVTAEDGRTIRNYTISVTKSEGGETAGAEGGTGGESTGISLESAAKSITILTPEEGVNLPAGFSESVIEIDGTQVKGWVWSSDPDYKYCVFYGMNEDGEKDFYRYDRKEMTLQRYFQDPAVDTGVTREEHEAVVNMYNGLLDDYKLLRYIVIGMSAVAVVLFAIVVYMAVKKNGGGGRPKQDRRYKKEEIDDFDDEMDDDDITMVRAEVKRAPVSREERYMRGEEDELEYEDSPVRTPSVKAQPVRVQPVKEEAPVIRQPEISPEPVYEAEEEDDFEIIDLE